MILRKYHEKASKCKSACDFEVPGPAVACDREKVLCNNLIIMNIDAVNQSLKATINIVIVSRMCNK